MKLRSTNGAIRLLTFTTLYPNAPRPQYCVFVENRLRHLVASGEVTAHVLAPIPYFPSRSPRFGTYAAFAGAPQREVRFGIEIDHPRYPVIPKVGMNVAPFLLYLAARRALGALLRAGHRFDLIDAHYFYPDGIAAVMLGRAFGLPVTVTARGSDINTLATFPLPRHLIRRAARQADGVIAVSRALATKLAALGVERDKIAVLRNGVDPALFRPVEPFRPDGGPVPRPLILSVGNLVPLKGHDLVITALTELPGATLWIVGGGPERARLEALARDLGVTQRVRFLGVLPHERMPAVYSAADALVLASDREGWPNVLLEAMACGTPVVTTKVSDVTDLVNAPAAGLWVEERAAETLAQAIERVLASRASRAATRAHAFQFTWDETTRGQVALFRELLSRRSADVR